MKSGKEKILVGMSGGVDSSVAAALLEERDYAVSGLFMRMHDGEKVEKDLADVKKVCEKLDIPLRTVDVRKKFQKEVVKYFLSEYAAGRTPNPCVFCNKNFKFKVLLEEAEKAGAELVATGHYARLSREFLISNFQFPNKSKIKNSKGKAVCKLFTAKDKNKDQSYFLYKLGQEELARIIFPLGEYEKIEVKKMAKKLGLEVSEKKESQDVCFMGGLTTEEFLRNNLKLKAGRIVDTEGKIIGEHDGLPLYTLGQRKGINIGGTGPYYVAAKDCQRNRLVVTNNKKETALLFKQIFLEDVSWVGGVAPKLPARVLVRSRYRNPLVYAIIGKRKTKPSDHEIVFEEPEKSLASGQSVVFYAKTGEVIGGGVIR